MSDPKDVVRRFFATLGTGDFAATGEFFTHDSVWRVNDVGRGLLSGTLNESNPLGVPPTSVRHMTETDG